MRTGGLAAALLAASLAGCGSSTTSGGGGAGSSCSNAGVVKLAIAGPMTGDAAADGEHIRQGAELAADEVNRSGGIAAGCHRGAKIQLDTFDDRETVDGSVSIANRVVSDSSYWAFLGTGFSDAALATAPVLDRSSVAYLSTYASSNRIVEKGAHHVFVVPPTFPAYAFSAAEVARSRGLSRVAILKANAAFGLQMADLFATRFRELGGTVVDEESYTLGDKNVESVVSKVRAAHPDSIAMAGLTDDDAAQLRQLHADGVEVPVVDTEAVLFSDNFLKLAGADAEGVVGQTPSDPQRNTPAAAALRDAYRSRYGTATIPDPAAFTYEAVKAVAKAMESGPADRTALSDALRAIRIDDTGVGALSFDPSGARLGGVLWYFHVAGGRFVFDAGYRQTGPRSVTRVPLER